MQTNQQFDLAFNLLQNTGTNLFLTGKAGTGKTTFLKLSIPFSNCRLALIFRLHRNIGEEKQISKTNSARIKSISSAAWTYW